METLSSALICLSYFHNQSSISSHSNAAKKRWSYLTFSRFFSLMIAVIGTHKGSEWQNDEFENHFYMFVAMVFFEPKLPLWQNRKRGCEGETGVRLQSKSIISILSNTTDFCETTVFAEQQYSIKFL